MSTDDPVSVFNAAADAIDRKDWPAVAALCDPVSLVAFKREFLSSITPPNPQMQLTVDDLMRHDPDMSREAAEYQLAQQRKFTGQGYRVANELGVESLAEAEAMTPQEFFTAWLDAHSFPRQLERQIADGLVPRDAAKHLMESFPNLRRLAFDAVIEGNLAYVVYRWLGPNMPGEDTEDEDPEWQQQQALLSDEEKQLQSDLANRPSWTTCRRQSTGEWRLIATQNFMHMGNGLFFVVHDEVE
jgi:transposase